MFYTNNMHLPDSELILNIPTSKFIPPEKNGLVFPVGRQALADSLQKAAAEAKAKGLRPGQIIPGTGTSHEAMAVVRALDDTYESGFRNISPKTA